jgi:hypothetical protein
MFRFSRPIAACFALCSIALLAPSIEGCGGGASCNSLCSNVIDLCTTESDSVDLNNCIEQCNERIEPIPTNCASERDDLLECISGASVVNCSDPQESAACSTENQALVTCLAGGGSAAGGASGTSTTTSTTGGDGGQSAGGGDPIGHACETDHDCSSGICNEDLNVCSTAGKAGTPCFRDSECSTNLCNESQSACSTPGPIGTPCFRDSECSGNLCNESTSACAKKNAAGGPCFRDTECTSNKCDMDQSVCD